jgi:hypothetical protein
MPVLGNPLELASNGDLTTGDFTVTAGLPVNVSLAFSATNRTTGTIDTGADNDASASIINFTDTLSFATNVPVFNLATGDVNSVEGNIVDSQYAAVPELSTWAMMLLGFAGLGFARYRKARVERTALAA